MRRLLRLPAAALLLAPALATAQSPLDGLHFRSIGPAVMGGRLHDVEVDPNDHSTIYVAAAGGGLWKTTNKGTTWAPIFDKQVDNSFGDVAIFGQEAIPTTWRLAATRASSGPARVSRTIARAPRGAAAFIAPRMPAPPGRFLA